MATRINTKFAIILAAAVLLVGAGGVFAVMKFLLKSAEQYAAMADESLALGLVALEAGDYEEANAQLDRAAGRYNAAHQKDPNNTEYVYKSIDANEAYLCESETEALNRLSMIAAASQIAHDSQIATEDDRRQYYERLISRHRMGLIVSETRPWISSLYRATDALIDANEDDDLARRWRGIAGVYLLRNDMPPEERAESLDDLNHALEQNENDAQVLYHLAVWHLNEARRLLDAAGGVSNDASTEMYDASFDFVTRVLEAEPEDPALAVDCAELLLRLPATDEVRDAFIETMMPLARRVATDADTRALLYDSELLRIVGWLETFPRFPRFVLEPTDEESAEAARLALGLGEAVLADAPNALASYHIASAGYIAADDHEAAVQALEDGLALDHRVNGLDFMLDAQTRLSMLYMLANTYTTMAAEANPDVEARNALLDKAGEVLERYEAIEGAEGRNHQANIDFLAGRAAFVRDVPHIAVQRLEAANQYLQNSNPIALMLLAKAHDRNGNTGEAIKYYELLLAPGMRPQATTERFRLVQIYTGLGGDKLQLADQHISLFLEHNPGNIQALLLKARILATNEQYDVAAQIVETIGLEENPQFLALYAFYLFQSGEEEAARELIDARLAAEPNDTSALSALFQFVPDPEQRQVELDRLIALGMTDENALQAQRVIDSNGRMTPEEWALQQAEGGASQLSINKRLYNTFRQSGAQDKMRETLALLVAEAPNDKDVLGWRFDFAIQDKDWDEAERVIEATLAQNPNNRPQIAANNGAFMRAQLQSARLLDGAGNGEVPDLREVIRSYQSALEANPTFAPGWIDLGKMYFLQQDWVKARDAFDRAYTIQPNNLQASILLARTLRQMGQIDSALDLYRDLTRRYPNNRGLVEEYLPLEANMGVRRIALQKREELREQNPADSTNRRMLALMYAQDRQFEEALAEIDQIIDLEGVTLSSTNAKAEILVMDNEPEQGAALFDAYLADRGDEADEADYLAYAMFIAKYGEAAAAEAAFRQAIAVEDPNTRVSSRQWASTLAQSNRLEEASALYEDLARSFPDEDPLKVELVKIQIASGNFDRALSVLAGISASAEKEVLRAQTEMYRGDPEAALAVIKNAQRTYDNHNGLLMMEARLLSELGEAANARGDAAEARRRFNAALAIYEPMVASNPRLYEIRVLIARIDHRLGKSDQAIDRIVRVLDEQPGSYAGRMTLYTIYMDQARMIAAGDPRRTQRAASALSAIQPLIEIYAENLTVLRSAGAAATEAGQFSQAARFYETAFGESDATGDLQSLVASLLANRQPRDAIVILDNTDHADHIASSVPLRAMQARALAGTNQTTQARNLFTNLLGRAQTPEDISGVIDQLSLSQLSSETAEIVEGALGEDRPPAVELQLAQIERARGDWEAVITRLTPLEDRPTGDNAIDLPAMLALSLAYQSRNDEESLLHSKRIYETLLENPAHRNNIELLNNLAYLLSGRLQGENYGRQAVTYAQRAVELVGENGSELQRAQILDTLGWAHFRAGNNDEAIKVLKDSIRMTNLSVNNMHLGQVYMTMPGRANENFALQYLDDARRASNNPAERDMIQRIIDQFRARPQP